MLLAHNGEDHGAESAVTTDEHAGHVQSTTTQQASPAGRTNSQGLFFGGGIAFLVLVAALFAWATLGRKKATEAIRTLPDEPPAS